MLITLIAAVDINLGIGNKNNELLFNLPKDMKYFKEKTVGKKIVMGRTTFESLPENKRPLPDRETYVLTTDKNYTYEGVNIIHSIKDVISLGKSHDVWVCGGGKVYEQLIKHAQRLVLTHVHVIDASATTFFPEYTVNDWKLVKSELHQADEKHPFNFVFAEYEKIKTKKQTKKKK